MSIIGDWGRWEPARIGTTIGGGGAAAALRGAWAALAAPWSIDHRSLALFRIALGVCLLADLWSRLDNLTVFHTDAGAMPRTAVLQFWDGSVVNSLFMLTGGYWGVLGLMLLAGIAYTAFLVGYRARIAGIVSLVFLVSLQARNYAIVQGSDDLLRLLLFWSLFLPLDRYLSVDRALDPAPPVALPLVASIGAVALLLQSSYVYVVGAVIKGTSPVWFPLGQAVYYAMNIDQFTTPLSPYLRAMPEVMTALTYFVFFLELLAPPLMLLPFIGRKARWVVLPLLLGMHAGFALFLQVGIFPLVSMTSLLPFLTPAMWDRASAMAARRRGMLRAIHYDRPCAFCHKTCLLLRNLLALGPVPVTPAQDDAEAAELLRRHNSWVVTGSDGAARLKWAAVVFVLECSPVLFPLAWPLRRLGAAGDALYDMIGRNRGALGALTARPLKLAAMPAWRPRRSVEAGLAALVAGIAFWNLTTIPGNERMAPRWLTQIALVSRLEQKWDMFAPYPLVLDGWYTMAGRLADGGQVDLLLRTPTPPSFDKPDPVADTYADQRWRKYLVNLTGEQFTRLRPWYADWICRDWNGAGPLRRQLETVELYFTVEPTPPPGETRPLERRHLLSYRCRA